MSLAPIIMVG